MSWLLHSLSDFTAKQGWREPEERAWQFGAVQRAASSGLAEGFGKDIRGSLTYRYIYINIREALKIYICMHIYVWDAFQIAIF